MTKSVDIDITAAEIARLSERSQAKAQQEHRAQTVRYDAINRQLHIETCRGEEFDVSVDLLQGVAGAEDSQIADMEILPGGEGLYWPELDASLLVHGICTGTYGSKRWMESLTVGQVSQ